ncbi:MAG TPA: tetratricopeptide repeat protein, partial [Longimicrobiaceae bacterium]|nr:tetratricopeptide repeat protein [Longimicrobiaceae bacterium]
LLLARLREHGTDAAVEDVQQRILAIDPHADLSAPAPERVERPAAETADELALNFYGSVDPGTIEPEGAGAEPLPGLDLPLMGNELETGGIPPLEGLEVSGVEGVEAAPLEGLETSEEFAGLGGGGVDHHDPLPLLGADLEPASPDGESPDLSELLRLPEAGDGDALPLLDLGAGPEPEPLDLLLPEIGSTPEESRGDPVEELRERVASAPEDTASLYRLVDLLDDRGNPDEASVVLAAAHRDLGARGLYREAIDAVRSLMVRRPDDTALYQKQVEYAFRAGDTGMMVRAYLDLGRHLGSPADNAKSRAVYQRVLELDPGNEEARRMLAPPPPPGPRPATPAAGPRGDYVDLGALILDDEDESRERSTRFVVEEEEPTGDEDRDFAEMLAVFRRKVNENIDAEDSSSHYDLGLAFMEMGLIDEAISQLQVALRGGANPLATLELLGRCFVEKGQPAVAARVLERALRLPGTTESEVVGVVYQLGRCHEALGNAAAAREMYERVLAFDIGFRDTLARLEALRESSGTRF